MCGEKPLGLAPAGWPSGSPPHVRGKGCDACTRSVYDGITPACAGKRALRVLLRLFRGDHPRMCGEKIQRKTRWNRQIGSPPHVRGKDFIPCRCPVSTGITPACAGKRLKRSRSTVPAVAIVPLFPSVCNKPVVSDGSPAGRDAPLFLPAENAVPASPAYNLRSL